MRPLDRRAFARALGAWFAVRSRVLPWRSRMHRRDPYAVLVSEAMLQQTQVARVAPAFQRWMRRWPTVEALAAADEADVLAAWRGLGYYDRARRLHRAARTIVEVHQGHVPARTEELLALPGVGPYTASAVRALAFDRPAGSVDGNVARVLARVTGSAVDVSDASARAELVPTARAIVSQGRARLLAEALIELGATVCRPRDPRCEACPVAAWCIAHREATTHEIPIVSSRSAVPDVPVAAAWIERDGCVLLRKRHAGLLGGLWGLPMAERRDGEEPADVLGQAVGAPVVVGRELGAGPVRHAFTHKRYLVRAYRCDLDHGDADEAIRWVQRDDLLAEAHARLDQRLIEACLART